MNMDSEPSDILKNTSGETTLERENVKKNEVKAEKSDPPIPPIISPINSPVKSKETPTEEVRLMFCAPDQTAAENVAKQLPKSSYMGQARSKRHFVFSTHLKPTEIVIMKDDVNQILKLPTNMKIVNFYVVNEDRIYNLEEKHKHPALNVLENL